MLTHPSPRTADERVPSVCLSGRRDRHRAFTLIELLAVIAIIGLLLAILLPALRAARSEARLEQAGAQARQIQDAVFAYATDYDDVLPPAADTKDDGTNLSQSPYWSQLLVAGEYIETDRPAAEGPPNIFFSPDHVRSSKRWWKRQWKTTGFGATNWGAMAQTNRGNLSQAPHAAPPARQKDARGPAPAKVLTLVDNTDKKLFDKGQGDGWYAAKHMFTYNGALARSYLDGHVSTGSSEQVHWIATGQRTGDWDLGGKNLRNYAEAPWFGRLLWDNDPWE